MLSLKVIGGNNAFSYDNSSFLITYKYDAFEYKLLFDCPFNAFNYIVKNNINVENIWISHTHFDHIGGLEQLSYYNYFVKNKLTNIYAHGDVLNELKIIFKNTNFVYDNGSKIETDIVRFYDINDLSFTNLYIRPLKGNHVIKENYGLIFEINYNNHSVSLLITGDTKASQEIRDEIEWLSDKYDKLYVFHDFSYIDNPFKNIHCCETDFNYYYKDLLNNDKIKWFKYHNEEFNKKFKDKVIKIL